MLEIPQKCFEIYKRLMTKTLQKPGKSARLKTQKETKQKHIS